MATPKLYKNYPPEWSELFIRAASAPVRIPFETKIEAKRFRNVLYAFRKSIMDPADNAPDAKLILIAPLLELAVEENKVLLHRPKRQSNIRKALENATR